MGCDTVERVFRTPHSIGGTAKNIDKTFDMLAADYKLTDMRNDMGSVMNSFRQRPAEAVPTWGAMPQGDNAIGGAVGGARVSENIGRDAAGRMQVAFEKTQTVYEIGAPRPNVTAIDRTDLRTVKPA